MSGMRARISALVRAGAVSSGWTMPIVCQTCNNSRATVHLTDVSDTGEPTERHLCDECASKEGLTFKTHETTTAILQEFLKQKVGVAPPVDIQCPDCGVTLLDFQNRGLLGCPNDYQVFGQILSQIIERAHEGATHHVGKVPKAAGAGTRRATDLRRLHRELQEAINREEYERASELRDQISAVESS